MAYKVINRFKDTENEGVVYEVGNEYPKGDHKPTKKRIEELMKVHPKYRVSFIEETQKKSTKKE